MRPVRSLIAGYLALCLALAGAVGLSPALHVLIEHGGRGPAHVHTLLQFDDDVLAHIPAQQATETRPFHSSSAGQRSLLVENHRPFELPLGRIFKPVGDLIHFLATHGDKPRKHGQHEHNSLPQSLASGLVSQYVPVCLLAYLTSPTTESLALGFTPSLTDGWYAATAPRGPPAITG